MKHILAHITSLYLALFFIAAGMGLNLVHYDCDECAQRGIAHIIEEMDASTHHDCDGDDHHHEGCCTFQHLSVDQPVLAIPTHLPTISTLSLLLSHLTPILPQSDSLILVEALAPNVTHSTPPLLGRTISIRNCSFLI